MELNWKTGMFMLSALVGVSLMAETFIGVASTRGSMSVDHASVRGNANISEGTSIFTIDDSTQIQLRNGVQITLGGKTEAAVHMDRTELKSGGASVNSKSSYRVDALGFQFIGEKPGVTTHFTYQGNHRVLVAAENGSVRVLHPNGVLLAKLNPGSTYSVEDQGDPQTARGAGKSGPAKVAVKTGLSKAKIVLITAGVAAGAGVTAAVIVNASR